MGRAGIKLATPGSAVRLASVARHVTDCATQKYVHKVLVNCLFKLAAEKSEAVDWDVKQQKTKKKQQLETKNPANVLHPLHKLKICFQSEILQE